MHPVDKQYLESLVRAGRWAYIVQFSVDLAVGAAMAVLIIKEYFGQHNQIACLIVIVYAQLAAMARAGILQSEGNSDKIDIVKGGDSEVSRELWDQIYIAQSKRASNFFILYVCLRIALIGVAFWKLYSTF